MRPLLICPTGRCRELPSASAQNFFYEQAGPEKAKLSNGFNESTRRANHLNRPSSPSRENILIFRNRKSVYIHHILSHSEGRCATSPTRGGHAVDADGAPDEGRWKRTAKSCGPDTPMLVSSSRSSARATVAKVQGSPRRSPISRKPLRGECRVIPV